MMNIELPWAKEFQGAITICDTQGVILDMNEKAVQGYASSGGRALIGQNALECHPEPARTKLKTLLAEGRTNVYTIEKKGVKKLIYQAPWYRDGLLAGFVELSLEIPAELPHYIRK